MVNLCQDFDGLGTSSDLHFLQTVLPDETLGQSYGIGNRANLKGKCIEHLIVVSDLLENRPTWVPL